eukprot:1158437-Pelagomonas_calceolata.AAC.13
MKEKWQQLALEEMQAQDRLAARCADSFPFQSLHPAEMLGAPSNSKASKQETSQCTRCTGLLNSLNRAPKRKHEMQAQGLGHKASSRVTPPAPTPTEVC